MPEISQKLSFDAQQAIANLSRLTTSIAGANKSMDKMQSTASTGAKSLDKITDTTKKSSKAAEEFSVSWKTIIRVLQTQLIVRGLNSVITGLRDAIENARELGLAIEEVRTIDAAGRTATDISEQVLALSDAIGQAPTDLAEGLYQTLSNQVVEAGEAFQFMSEAARLAKVTASETGDAVNALSSVMNSYNLASSEAEHVAGTLFATVEQGRLRLGEIANVIGRVTPLTAQLGITWEETAAAIATMTRQGVRADTAITQLRAVVTRLLKPTEEMSAIFRKWGVEDGRQAILTFGGLSGVLKKLAQETGNNSGEMAKLLRNVRAIAGVFGIMSNEGKTLEEVLDHITKATTDATGAWAEYAKSDAQKLTAEMQKFDNQLTRVGASSLPLVTRLLKDINIFIDAQSKGIMVITGVWSEADQAAFDYAQVVKKGLAEGIKLEKELAAAGKGRYDFLTTASLKYYAEANKKEQELAATRDNAIASATAVFENAVDGLTDLYSDNLKKIEQFAEQAASNVESSFQRMADLRKEVGDRILERDLESAKSNVKKLEILDATYLSSLEKRRDAAAKISADPQTIKDFNAATKVSLGLLDRRLALAKEMGASISQQTAHRQAGINLLKETYKGEEQFALAAKQSELALKAGVNALSETEARVKVIGAQIKEIHKDGVTPEEHKELDILSDELDKLGQKSKEINKTFKDLGLDVEFSSVVDGLTDALNQAHKDWDAEVELAKAKFANLVIPIQVSLDPGGALAKLQKVLGQEKLPGESAAAFAGRGDQAAQKILETKRELEAQIVKLRGEGTAPLQETSKQLDSIAQKNNDQVQSLTRQFNLSQGITGVLLRHDQHSQAALQGSRDRLTSATSLHLAHAGVLDKLKQEQAIHPGTLQALKDQTKSALDHRQITQDRFDLYTQIHDELEGEIERNKELLKLQELKPEKEILATAEDVAQKKRELVDATKIEAEQQEKIKQAEAERVKTLEAAKKTVEGTANAAEKTANATGNADTQAGNFTSSVEGADSALDAIGAKMSFIADEAERAADAAAQLGSAGGGSGAASQYYGGPHYADGGVFRGQDQQLTALAKGETVTNQKNSRRFFSELNAMNQGSQPVYRDQGGPVTNVGDVNVTVKGGDSSQQTVREIGHALRREVKRGNLKFR